MRFWNANDAEPTSWQVTTTDSTFTMDQVGLRAALLATANVTTNFLFDDLVARSIPLSPGLASHD